MAKLKKPYSAQKLLNSVFTGTALRVEGSSEAGQGLSNKYTLEEILNAIYDSSTNTLRLAS